MKQTRKRRTISRGRAPAVGLTNYGGTWWEYNEYFRSDFFSHENSTRLITTPLVDRHGLHQRPRQPDRSQRQRQRQVRRTSLTISYSSQKPNCRYTSLDQGRVRRPRALLHLPLWAPAEGGRVVLHGLGERKRKGNAFPRFSLKTRTDFVQRPAALITN